MKPASFDYFAPRTLDEALRILAEAGPDGRVLAGGQSLMPMLNFRIARPAVIVDINRIPGLDTIEAGAEQLKLGPLVRHAHLLRTPAIREGWPLMAEAATLTAHMAIRNRGTVAGSVCHNDPAAEQPSVLATLEGTVEIASIKNRRSLRADQFLTGMMANALEPGEMVVGLSYPRPAAGTGAAFVEFSRRRGDFALAGAAAMLTVKDGQCVDARLTIVGMGKGPARATKAEALLKGKIDEAWKSKAIAAAATAAQAEVEPADDVHATAAYRRYVAGHMATEALNKAFARAGGHTLG